MAQIIKYFGFSLQIQADFIISKKNLETNKEVFDELQTVVDVYKFERSDFKKKIESLFHIAENFL